MAKKRKNVKANSATRKDTKADTDDNLYTELSQYQNNAIDVDDEGHAIHNEVACAAVQEVPDELQGRDKRWA
ncbi:hypothetical protein CspHIS471_0312400 [Cutaneotrichosporon sp. HIS471]|nr:hypothetical protein CspHIS471_0312400 [Cutaneotrichosporon sp. HIS471]